MNEYEADMAQSRQQAQGLIAQTVDDVLRHENVAMMEMASNITKRLDDSHQQIEQAHAKAVTSVEGACVDLTIQMIERMTGARLTPDHVRPSVAAVLARRFATTS